MKKLLAILLTLVMVFSLAACGGGGGGTTGGGTTGGETEARTDLIMQLAGEPASLDYQQDTSVITQVMMNNVTSGLVGFDKNNEITGVLAESWEWNEDYTAITFKLRDGLVFSDGSPLTTKDVEYTIQRGIDLGFSPWFSYIASMEVISDTEIKLNLTQPYTVFLNVLALAFFGVMPEGAEEKWDIASEAPISSGAYYVDSWTKGESIILKANPNYFEGEAAIKEVKYVFIGDENSALVALETGEIDFMQGGGNISSTSRERIEQVDGLTTVPNKKETYAFLALNFGMPELADKNVRQAIDYAIDRAAMTSVFPNCTPAGSVPATPNLSGYLEGYDATKVDVEKAKELMAASAYPNGFNLEIMSPNASYTKVATLIQADLAKIGITVSIRETDTSTAIADMQNGNYQAGIMSWGNANGDVTNPLAMYQAGAAMHFNNDPDPTCGDLLAKSLTVAGEERDAVLKEAYDYMVDYVPYIGLYWPSNNYGINEKLVIDYPIAVAGYVLYSMHWEE